MRRKGSGRGLVMHTTAGASRAARHDVNERDEHDAHEDAHEAVRSEA